MVALSENVESQLRAMRDARVLDDMCGNRLNADKGVILVACADGDQMFDLFTHQAKIQRREERYPRLHTLTEHGGALVLPRHSPLNEGDGDGSALVRKIASARRLKAIDAVALYSHFPCAMASEFSVPAIEQLRLQARAKDRLKAELTGVRVSLFLHVHWQDEERRTYHISRKRLDEWMQSRSD